MRKARSNPLVIVPEKYSSIDKVIATADERNKADSINAKVAKISARINEYTINKNRLLSSDVSAPYGRLATLLENSIYDIARLISEKITVKTSRKLATARNLEQRIFHRCQGRISNSLIVPLVNSLATDSEATMSMNSTTRKNIANES